MSVLSVRHNFFFFDERALCDESRQNHICLQLPMTVAKQYGETPVALLGANERTRAQITVDVKTSDVIQDIRSPTIQDTRRNKF